MANSSNNRISFYGDDHAMKDFMKSTINSCNTVIEHYDFVIKDISSEISNPKLEATKGPVIAFLKELMGEWITCRDDVQRNLDKLEKRGE